jgi:deazaflavin-dependent oxidoreductase (nitroreductase family)
LVGSWCPPLRSVGSIWKGPHDRGQTDTYKDFDVNTFQRHIAEFREKKEKLGGMFEGWTLVVLTTVGAKTGLRRTTLLGYLEFDGKPVVVASAMGAPTHPARYHNIRHNPIVTVETGTETYEAIAAIPSGDERDKLFDKVLDEAPGFAGHQANTTRVIPVVVLHRVEPEPGAERAEGMGDWLVEVHDWLRQELNGAPPPGGQGSRQQRGLRHYRADTA